MLFTGAEHTGSSCFQVVICGKAQTGKSSLVNSLTGGMGMECHFPERHLNAYQMEVTSHGQSFDILLWDSPGLGGAFGNNEEILQQVVKKAKGTDLLVYCLDMRRRLEQDDVDGITQLTSRLGKEVWRNAVFALTYANDVNPPPHSTADKIQFFQRSLSEWKSVIKQVLRNKTTLSENEINTVAIVPVGYRDNPPPGDRFWLRSFWSKALHEMEQDILLEGIHSKYITSGVWRHREIAVGVVAGFAIGALFGLGVGGAVVGGVLGGIGGGAIVFLVKHVVPATLYKKIKEE